MLDFWWNVRLENGENVLYRISSKPKGRLLEIAVLFNIILVVSKRSTFGKGPELVYFGGRSPPKLRGAHTARTPFHELCRLTYLKFNSWLVKDAVKSCTLRF
jgi:hypothetical protein